MAREEVRAVAEYDYVVVNDEIDDCVDRLRAIVVAERAKPDVMAGEVASIVASFGGAAADAAPRKGWRDAMARVALGITGGIGAYKAVEVARGLQKRGHDVVAVMTRNARRFVGPVTLEAITRHPVVTSQWTAGSNADIEHISLASSIDLLLVAPATANILGKFAGGIADDFLSALYLATTAPVLVAPAMNSNMLGASRGAAERPHPRGAWRARSSNREPAIWPAAGSARAGSPSPTTSWRPPTASSAVTAPSKAGASW